MDLQRIVSYDYLLVHTSDVPRGPKSLHPAVPHRGAELLVNQATNLTGRFVRLLMSQYSKELAERASWVTKQFYEYTDEELASYISQNVGQWGSEFDRLTAIDLLDL